MIRGLDSQAELFLASIKRIEARQQKVQSELSSGLRVSSSSDAPDRVVDILRLRSEIARITAVGGTLERVTSEVNSGEAALRVGVQLGVTVKVQVGVLVAVKVRVGVLVGLTVKVQVGVFVRVGVWVLVLVEVLVRVKVQVGVVVQVKVRVGVRVGVGVGMQSMVTLGLPVELTLVVLPALGLA